MDNRESQGNQDIKEIDVMAMTDPLIAISETRIGSIGIDPLSTTTATGHGANLSEHHKSKPFLPHLGDQRSQGSRTSETALTRQQVIYLQVGVGKTHITTVPSYPKPRAGIEDGVAIQAKRKGKAILIQANNRSTYHGHLITKVSTLPGRMTGHIRIVMGQGSLPIPGTAMSMNLAGPPRLQVGVLTKTEIMVGQPAPLMRCLLGHMPTHM
jgi:hypothetical protein